MELNTAKQAVFFWKIKKETSILRRIINIGMCTFFYHCYFFLKKGLTRRITQRGNSDYGKVFRRAD